MFNLHIGVFIEPCKQNNFSVKQEKASLLADLCAAE